MKQNKQNYVEFVREKENIYTRCLFQKADAKEEIWQHILLEEFKGWMSEFLSVYFNKQKAVMFDQAVILADEFFLTHKANFLGQYQPNEGGACSQSYST